MFIAPGDQSPKSFLRSKQIVFSPLKTPYFLRRNFLKMAFSNPQQEKTLTAFLTALSYQEEPLPAGLQKQLHAIGQNLDARIVELPTIAASLPNLNEAYQTALAQTQTGDQGATLVSTNQDKSEKLRDRGVQILTAADPVRAAQRQMPQQSGRVASNPFKRLFGLG
jgi:hypothetical protein